MAIASIRFCSCLILVAGIMAGQDGARWWRHVEFLADDKLEGRNTGSAGHKKAADYVAAQFERAGLKPAGMDGGYIQPVKFATRTIDEAGSSVGLVRGGKTTALKLGDEVVIGLRTDPAARVEAGLVFVGYGLTVPEQKFDDFAGLDVRGKVIVYLTGAPAGMPGALSSHYQ